MAQGRRRGWRRELKDELLSFGIRIALAVVGGVVVYFLVTYGLMHTFKHLVRR
jgi:hypothetical protein